MTPRVLESRRLLSLILLAAFGWSLLNVGWSDGILHVGGLRAIGEIGGALFRPEFSGPVLGAAAVAAWRTMAYAVAGLSLALVLGIPLGVAASGVLQRSRVRSAISIGAVRGALAFLR